MNQTFSYSSEVKSLTGLRGIAALWVVGYHCQRFLPSHPLPRFLFAKGFLGVDIFFVLSGFLLASLYADLTFRNAGRFWIKRVCRIYPLHLTVMAALAVIVSLATLAGGHVGPFYAIRPFFEVAALVHVYVGTYGWNDPTWSIAVEMGCYLTLPFMLPGLRALPAPLVIITCIALLLADAALIVIVYSVDDGRVLPVVVGWVPVVRGFLGFTAGCLLSRLLTLDTFRTGPICNVLASVPLFRLGELSFSIYLLHQPIIMMVMRINPVLERHGASWLELPATLVVTFLLSRITYARIEVPGRRLPAAIERWLGGPARRTRTSVSRFRTTS